MNKENKWIYLIWECDTWMSYDSMILIQITDSHDKAINEIMNNIIFDKCDWQDYDAETKEEKIECLKDYVKEYLLEHDQTPNLRTNYIIQTAAINGIWSELTH